MENLREMPSYLTRIIICIIFTVKGIQTASLLTNLTATANPEFITSTNYPRLYPNSHLHYWSITANDKSDVVSIVVVDSEIEYGSNCQHDYVKVYDGPSDTYLRIGLFCGESQPAYKSTGHTLYIKFKTDSSKPYRGFKILYKSISPQISEEFNFSTKAVICSVLGILSTFLLFAVGNYFLRTARKSASFRRPSIERRTLTSVMYSISQSTGQTIVSIENGSRIQRSASGHIVQDDSSTGLGRYTSVEDVSLSRSPPEYTSSESVSAPPPAFSMVLNVQNLRIAPPSYDSVRLDEDDSSTVLGESPPDYEESTSVDEIEMPIGRTRIIRSMSLPS